MVVMVLCEYLGKAFDKCRDLTSLIPETYSKWFDEGQKWSIDLAGNNVLGIELLRRSSVGEYERSSSGIRCRHKKCS
jgi:hypothetical protein